MAWTKSVHEKGLAQTRAWSEGDVSTSPEQDGACELAGVPRARLARPLSACLRTRVYVEKMRYWWFDILTVR
jgi:hypothetical protein